MSDTRLRSYKFLNMVGQGAFSTVWHGVHTPTNTDVAIKMIMKKDMKESDLTSANDEIGILKSLQHPFIVGFYDHIETDDIIYLIMEYLDENSLLSYLKCTRQLPENEAARVFAQLLSSIEYLHKVKHVAHRDLKLENIMLTKELNVKLIDFNLSHDCTSLMSAKCGSLYYIAPEILKGCQYTESADVWSLGVILYSLVYGNFPFIGDNDTRTIQQIIYKKPHISSAISPQLNDLLLMLLNKNPSERITIDQIKGHKWISNEFKLIIHDFNNLYCQAKLITNDKLSSAQGNGICNIEDSLENAAICRMTFTAVCNKSINDELIRLSTKLMETPNFKLQSINSPKIFAHNFKKKQSFKNSSQVYMHRNLTLLARKLF